MQQNVHHGITSEWVTLNVQNNDNVFPLEGHTTFYWEHVIADDDELENISSSSINNKSTYHMIVLYGGISTPFRTTSNSIYCMVPRHVNNTSSLNTFSSPNNNNKDSSLFLETFQWVNPPTHYIPFIAPIIKTQPSSSSSNLLNVNNTLSLHSDDNATLSSSPININSDNNIINGKINNKLLTNLNRSSNNSLNNSFNQNNNNFYEQQNNSELNEIPLHKSRYDHTMVLAGDNKAYLFGGRNGLITKSPLQDFYLYSLDMNISKQFTWEIVYNPCFREKDINYLKQNQKSLNDLYFRESPIPRYGHTCISINQRQQTAGSGNTRNKNNNSNLHLGSSETESDSGLSDQSAGDLLNTTSSTGSESSRFNTDSVIILDCAILLFGGVAMVDYSTKKCREVNDFWMFNCIEKKWLSYPSIIERYFKNSSHILRSKASDDCLQEISLSPTTITISNIKKNGKATNNNNMNNSSNNNFNFQRGPIIDDSLLPEARYGHIMCAVSNAVIYVIGGSTLNKEKYFKDIWQLSLTSFEWRKVNLIAHKSNEKYISKIPIRYAAHTVIGRKILIYGGQLSYRSGDYLTEILCFDTETYRLSIIENSISPQFNTGLVRATMLLYGLDLFVFGGKRGVNSLKFNDIIQKFSLKLKSIPQMNRLLAREGTKFKTNNQVLTHEEIMQQMQMLEAQDDEQEHLAAENAVKIQLIAHILMSDLSSSDFSRKEALRYMIEAKEIDIVKQLFRDINIHKSLANIIQSGSKSDIRLTCKVLRRFFKDTDQGTLPFIIARQVLRFIESYLTLINSLIRLNEPIKQTLHIDYLSLFHLMCQNFEFYESLSKEFMSVFQQCFKMNNPLCKATLDILSMTIDSLHFLSLNAMHFASKCDKELCKTIKQFMKDCQMAKDTAKTPIDQNLIYKIDELLLKLKETIIKLAHRSRIINKQFSKLIRLEEEKECL
ncbi:hypothetical protein ABK040_000983 [Willaertia magna]